ncbi:hypothetical protein CTAYLR_004794 [Chrysophaeum taylorii]|uniref:EF-hand domain-containing protein n=1 Tax=Chrysophaeum taylorii TaxID=2483200 RepID=A0AAD7UNL9_9STRA|nr:hypothetical protein CTAYLR_004794 [Chrysophaeum taylorii]
MAQARIIASVQHMLAAKGARGATSLLRSFRSFDTSGRGVVSFEEFARGLESAGLRLNDGDVRTLFLSLDSAGTNTIDVQAFVNSLAGEVSPRRRALIERVFRNIAGSDEAASLSDVGACFRADRHPEVERGVSTPSRVLSELLEALRESGTLVNGRVTRDGLVSFYRLSAAFVGDAEFEAVMEAVWVPRAPSKARRQQPKSLGEAAVDDAKPTAALLEAVRESLASRGTRGIVGLSRRFRIGDRDKSGFLDEAEFCRSMREQGLGLRDDELRALFRAMDGDGSGGVDYAEFLKAARGEMSARRRGLVTRAFDILDADKSGAIEPQDMVHRYDASRHPDVLKGLKTADDVLRDFLDTFDVGGVVDGKVTRAEFDEYYANVSSTIDDDDYFELVMRNAWHIPGGPEGWNAANLRVLVARSDGSRAVEAVRDDLGLEMPRDRSEIIRRLRAQGVDAVHVSVPGGDDDDANVGRPPRQQQKPATTPEGWSPGVASVVARIRQRVAKMGPHGYHALKRAFHESDKDGDGFLRRGEFVDALERTGAERARKDAEAVFLVLDRDPSSSSSSSSKRGVEVLEVTRALAGPMSSRRKTLVRLAFDAIDAEGAGAVPPDVVARRFDPTASSDGTAAFMEHFDVGSEREGLVTLADFEAYHALLSANEPDDERFEAYVRGVWRVADRSSSPAPATTIRVRAVHASGYATIEELPDEPGLRDAKGGFREREAIRRLKLGGINATTAELVDELPTREAFDFGRPPPPPMATSLAAAERRERERAPEDARRGDLSFFKAPGPSSAPQSAGDGAAAAGVAAVARRLAAQLRTRGQHGFVALRRSLRAASDDAGFASLASFKSAVRAAGIDASDAELRALFSHVDVESTGLAASKACLDAIRPKMSPRRATLVELAFERVDVHANGTIAPSVLAARFDASRAPSVLAGRQTKQAAYESFLQTFDVDPRSDGRVSKRDFFEFHADLSAVLVDDDVFFAFVRDVWRLPASVVVFPNDRDDIAVVARRIDGRQTVEHLPAALRGALDLDDADALVAALRDHCGVSASSAVVVEDDDAPLAFGADGGAPNVAASGAANVAAAAELVSRKFEDRPRGRRMVGGLASRATGGDALPGRSAPARKVAAAKTTTTTTTTTKVDVDPGVATIAARLRADLVFGRGLRALVALERKLRAVSATASSGSSRHLTLEELSRVLRECDVKVAPVELRALFATCDRDGNGTVDWADFLSTVRPPLSAARREAVRGAWRRVFGADASRVPAQDVAERYDAASHPEVLARKSTADAQLRLFLDTFDVGDESPGVATVAEFEAYHANVGAAIRSDDDFDAILAVWQPPPPEPPAPATTTRSAPLSVAAARRAQQRRREPADEAPAAGVSSAASSVADAIAAPSPRPQRPPLTTTKNRRQQQLLCGGRDGGTLGDVVGVERLFMDARRQLAQHGVRGIIGIGRKFRQIADDRAISMVEFKKAVRELGMLNLTDAEIRLLFQSVDVDGSGSIDYEEFLRAVRGEMNQRRKLVVRAAFDVLDSDGSGTVEPSEVASRFDASHHPDVVAGTKTRDDVYREFLETFDVGGDQDGKVTAREFENYYSNVSASVDDDDYFELVLRNAWHIPGGEGWCANTANLRVLVTRADGSQTVECVDDDLGLAMPRDSDEILRRIRAQGVADAVRVASAAAAPPPRDDALKATTSSRWGSSSSSSSDLAKKMPRTFREMQNTRAAGGATRKGVTGKKMHGYQGHGGMFSSQISFSARPVSAPMPSSRRGAALTTKSPNDVFHSVLGSDMREKKKDDDDDDDDDDARLRRSTRVKPPAAAGRPAVEMGASPDAALAVGSLGTALRRRDAKGVVERVRARLGEMGARGLAGLARKFHIIDRDNSKTLSAAEFATVMREMSLDLADADVSALFAAFDRDANGKIDYDEFLRAARGPLGPRRAALVDRAFAVLDKDESGFVDVNDIVDRYDASKHPDVIAGKATANNVLQEFLDTFEVGGERDGKVSKAEFHEYYANVSASIDSDDYFDLMIRNAWHVPGGGDNAANNNNNNNNNLRRVLVTRSDGTQSVESIRRREDQDDDDDDLAFDETHNYDSRHVLQQLKRQGIDAVSVRLYGAPAKPNTKTSNTYRTTFKLE